MKTCDIKVKKKYTSYLKILFKYNENMCTLLLPTSVNSDSCEAVSMSEIIISFACCIHISLLFPTNCILLSKL